MPETLVWKILLVDDDEDDYLLTREMLAMAQGKEIQLKWAASFDAGCQALDSDVYDAVLIDYDLGEHTGLELIRLAVGQDYPWPLVLITGRGGYEVDLEAMQAGATLYLTKSELNPPLLDRSIRYAIERKQTEIALRQARQELERRVQQRTQELARANLELESAQLTLESTVARRTGELRYANNQLADQMSELEAALSESQEKEVKIARLTRLYVTLSQINEAIVRTRDPLELYGRVCAIVAESGFPLVWIGEVQGQRVVPLAACGSAADYLEGIQIEVQGELGQGPTGRCIREDRTVVNDDFTTNPHTLPWRARARRYGIRASAAFPLHRQGRAIGSFTLYAASPGAFDAEMVSLLEQLGADISYALDAMEQEGLRAQAELALRSSEERYRSLFDGMTEGFALHEIICDEQGKPVDFRFLEINPAFETLTGLKREKVIGNLYSEVLPGDDPHWVEMYGKVALSGEAVHFENYSPVLNQNYEVYAYRPAPMQFAVLFMNTTQRKQMDEQLHQSETRLRRLYESGLQGVIYWNMDGKITDANDKFLEMTGYTRQELEAGLIDWAKMTPPEYQYLDERSIAELKATGVNAAPFEKEYIRKDGSRFPVIVAGAMLDEARFDGVAFALDISARKQVERALSEGEQRYRALFEGMQEGFYLARVLRNESGQPCDMQYLDANPAFERIMGRSREHIVGHTGKELVPSLKQEWLDLFSRVEQTGEPAHHASYSEAFRQYFEVFVFRPAEGQVAVLVNDISERKQAEEKLQQQSWLIEQSFLPIFTWDVEGGILSWNQGCEQIYGYTAAEALGRTSHELLQTHHPIPLEDFLAQLQGKGSWSGQLHQITKDGRQVIVESRQQLSETGGRRLVLETNLDITESIQVEQALREAHQRVEWLARFPEENPNPVVRVDFDNRILYRNPPASRLPGWEYAVGQPVNSALLPLIQRAVALGSALEEDVELDKGVYAVSAVPLPSEGYINIYGRNVARRRLVEQALELRSQELEAARLETENEKRLLEAVMEALPVGLAITDAQGGNYFNNPAFAQVWGGMKRVGSVSEYSSFQAWWADNGQPLAPEEWASAQAVVTGEPVVGQVLEIQRFDGKRAFVINSASPVRDASGNIVGSAVSVQDITSLRQAQQALRESEQRWATTLASIGDAVVTTDRQGCVTYFNPVAEKLSGWGRQEAAGLSMEQVFPLVNEETLRPAENPVEKVLHSGRVAGLANHTALIARSGRRIPIEDSAAPIQGSAGQILGVVMVFHDVTEKRKKEAALREADALMRDYAQKLERSNRELQDFASIASHDLQEPLRKIRAFSDLLQARLEGRLDEQELDMLKRMLSATNRMHELIDSLLTYSRVTTKAQPFKTVDLGEVAEEVVAGFEVQIERSGGRVELGDLPKVQADPVQMRQLLQNLVGNALKFHRDGVPPLVQISGGVAPASRESGTHPMVRLEVKDNGIGFDLRYLERIFRPFERLHGRGEFEGAGMGLAICKKIVERHQGSIDARSTVGEGSTFIVTLPVKPGQ